MSSHGPKSCLAKSFRPIAPPEREAKNRHVHGDEEGCPSYKAPFEKVAGDCF